MKRLKIVSFIVLTMLLLCTTHVLAADYGVTEPQLTIEGETTATPGETKTATVKITSPEVEVGVVSGTIQNNSNITNMTVKGINDWTLTYNAGTGSFNIYKAEGSKSEEVMTIEYTVVNSEATAEITMSNLKMTTIDYQSINISDVSKKITIANAGETPVEPETPTETEVTLTGIKVEKAPQKTTYKEGESFNKTGMVIIAQYSDGTTKEITNYTFKPQGKLAVTDTKITITYEEDGITKTTEQKITVEKATTETPGETDEEQKPTTTTEETKKDETTSDKEIPKAGISTGIVVAMLAAVAFTVITYRKNKKYKDVK